MSNWDDEFDGNDDVSPMEDDAYERDSDSDLPLMGWITLNDLSGDSFSDDEDIDDEDDDLEEWDKWGDEQGAYMERVCVICGDEFDTRSLRSGSQWRNRCNECNDFDDVKQTIHEQTRALIEGQSADRERQRKAQRSQ